MRWPTLLCAPTRTTCAHSPLFRPVSFADPVEALQRQAAELEEEKAKAREEVDNLRDILKVWRDTVLCTPSTATPACQRSSCFGFMHRSLRCPVV